MPRIPTVQPTTSPYTSFRLGQLHLPEPTTRQYGEPGWSALTTMGQAFTALEEKLRHQQDELDLTRKVAKYDEDMGRAYLTASQLVDETDVTGPKPASLEKKQAFLAKASDESLATLTPDASRAVGRALEQHHLRTQGKARVELLADSLKLQGQAQVVDYEGQRNALMDFAARRAGMGDEAADQGFARIERLRQGLVARGLLSPEQARKDELLQWDRYARAYAQSHPTEFLGQTEAGVPREGPLAHLDSAHLHQYREIAHWEEAGKRAEATRAEALQVKAQKAAIEATQNAFTTKMANNTLTVDEILASNLHPVGDGSKEHYVRLLEARAKELEKANKEPKFHKDPSTFLGVLTDIRAQKITSMNQVEQIYANSVARGSGIDWADVEQLRTELVDLRTPEGLRLGDLQHSFLTGVKAAIDKSNPLMGKIDQEGQQKYYEFTQYVAGQVRKLREQGKNPYVLFTPGTDEYLGTPEVLAPFQKSLQDSLRSMSQALRKTPPATTPSGGTPPKDQRRPDETIDQYLQRTGK